MHFIKIKNYVTPWDILKSKLSSKNNKLRIGWCAPFPPAKNGAAAATYWFVNELCKYAQLEIYALPVGGTLQKNLFPKVKYARLSDKNLDLIIFFCLGTYFLKFVKKTRAKTIAFQTAHSLDTKKQAEIEYKILKEINKADYIFAVTKYGKAFFERELKKNIYYVPLAVDLNTFTPLEKDKHFCILFQSRICFYKGIQQFLESMPAVLEKYPDVIFKIKGILDYPNMAFVNANINQKICDGVVSLLKKFKKNFYDNLIIDYSWSDYSKITESYQTANVLVFPSNNEGFGVPVIEAMSCGIPVIALNKAPMKEFIKNGKTGFLINCRKYYQTQNYDMKFPHPEDIAKKIIWLIEHPANAKKMGLAARDFVEKHYNLQKVAGKLAGLLVKLKNESFNNQ